MVFPTKAVALLLSATLQSRGLQLKDAVAPPVTGGADVAKQAQLVQETTSSMALDGLEAPDWPETTEKIFVPGLSPTEAGCLVRTPSGCPNHPDFASSDWRHAEFGIRYSSETEGREQCEVHRKEYVARWCGTEVVETLFIPAVPEELEDQADEVAPTEPGCFVRTLWGCPLHPSFSSSDWKQDEYGEWSADASASRTACEIDRKAHMQQWCGVEVVEMQFVPWPPGCYMRSPSGCPLAPLFGSAVWKRVDEGEENTGADWVREQCEVYVGDHCGSTDVEIKFIPPDWENLLGAGEDLNRRNSWGPPAKPSCFLRTPTGCPKEPALNTTSWRWDEHFGSPTNGAGADSRSACETARRAFVAQRCGADDIAALFVSQPYPGCYSRTRSDCPNHPSFGSRTWKREEDGEQQANANRTACEVDRKAYLQHWCGIKDFEMLFIPALAAS